MASTPDLETLLTQARNGNPSALNALLVAVQPELRSRVSQRLPLRFRAKYGSSDLLQEALTAAYRGFPGFRGSSSKELWGWLHTILDSAYRRIFERLGSRKRNCLLEQPLPDVHPTAPSDTPSREAMKNEACLIQQQALDSLPVEMKQVIELRTIHNLRYEEVARTMGRSEEAVRKLHARALLRWQSSTL